MSETLLAFDVGARRIGVAVGNDLVRVAHAAKVIDVVQGDGLDAVAAMVAEWQPARLVVGIPLALEGDVPELDEPHAALARCEGFARTLEARFRLPVERVDERYSSVEADAIHRERRRAGTARRAKALDDVAAQVILQRWFDALPMSSAA